MKIKTILPDDELQELLEEHPDVAYTAYQKRGPFRVAVNRLMNRKEISTWFEDFFWRGERNNPFLKEYAVENPSGAFQWIFNDFMEDEDPGDNGKHVMACIKKISAFQTLDKSEFLIELLDSLLKNDTVLAEKDVVPMFMYLFKGSNRMTCLRMIETLWDHQDRFPVFEKILVAVDAIMYNPKQYSLFTQ